MKLAVDNVPLYSRPSLQTLMMMTQGAAADAVSHVMLHSLFCSVTFTAQAI